MTRSTKAFNPRPAPTDKEHESRKLSAVETASNIYSEKQQDATDRTDADFKSDISRVYYDIRKKS